MLGEFGFPFDLGAVGRVGGRGCFRSGFGIGGHGGEVFRGYLVGAVAREDFAGSGEDAFEAWEVGGFWLRGLRDMDIVWRLGAELGESKSGTGTELAGSTTKWSGWRSDLRANCCRRSWWWHCCWCTTCED